MTANVDTSAEAVERLAFELEPAEGWPGKPKLCPHCQEYGATEEQKAVSATLRALAAERDAVRSIALNFTRHLEGAMKHRERLVVRVAELEAALAEAEKRLRGAGMLGGDDDPIRAALARSAAPMLAAHPITEVARDEQ